jgi:molybdopterin molybdotransferase
MAREFKFQSPTDAMAALAPQLPAVSETQSLAAEECVGRVLAEAVLADRDSPAADVSAMDGYAIRLADRDLQQPVAVRGESVPGNPPPQMQPQAVVRIFTGAIVPAGCEAVIKREDTEELEGAIRFRDSAKDAKLGENIRRRGENAAAGSTVLPAGTRLTAAHLATMANFGCFQPRVLRAVRVALITTGDEVGMFDSQPPQAWQLRNSNRFSLASLLQPLAWAVTTHIDHCRDDHQSLADLIRQRAEQCDAILLTGGVSMGDYDYVPDVVKQIGGEVIFHGLPIRPGKPILGAATDSGKLVLGLPGNPVSATVGCRRFAIPLLAKQSGQLDWNCSQPAVRLINPGQKTLPLIWLRLVRLTADGVAEPVPSQGSGDLVSLGQSSGFVEVPAGSLDQSAWPYYPWG